MTTLNKLIQEKSKEIFNIFEESSGLYITKSGKWRTSGGGYNFDFEKERKKIENTLANAIQSGYELAIKDVEKIIGKNEEYSQSGYFKEDNGEIITNDEIQGMNILKNELRLKLQLLLKKENQ